MQSDSKRTRVWFPMFSYFESSVDGMVPNEYDTLGSLIDGIIEQIFKAKDQLAISVKRCWLDAPLSGNSSAHMFGGESEQCLRNGTASAAFFSPHQSLIGGLGGQRSQTHLNSAQSGSSTPTPATSAPTKSLPTQKKTFRDASVDPFSRTTFAAVQQAENVKDSPMKEKKHLWFSQPFALPHSYIDIDVALRKANMQKLTIPTDIFISKFPSIPFLSQLSPVLLTAFYHL